MTCCAAQLDCLSNDILSWIVSHLTLPDISSVSLVSRRLHEACRTNALWKIKFEDRWNIDSVFRVLVTGQNWYKAYQAAYNNPHDLWIFHWNCTFPQDGLVPGRCCIYELPTTTSTSTTPSTSTITTKETTSTTASSSSCHFDLCPPCRFFPNHPLESVRNSLIHNNSNSSNNYSDNEETEKSVILTNSIAQATDRSLRDFATKADLTLTTTNSELQTTQESYSVERATCAFSHAATFHRTLDMQQYTAAPPRQESRNTTCLAPLTDLLFFNVTEEPLSTQMGQQELEHLRRERNLEQNWQQSIHARDLRRRNPLHEFSKPAYETAHHTWHQAVITNPDFVRPIVFRISVARPDCFVVFPSEGFLEPGRSKVITFGVRPLGSLVATAFETINAQRHAEPWMTSMYNEEGPLPCAPFCVRYKYSSVIPCIPARGFVSPHQPQPRHEETPVTQQQQQQQQQQHGGGDHNTPAYPSVADVCWDQKQMIDYHWEGAITAAVTARNGDDHASATVVEPHEIRNIYLSAHVNAHYPFHDFHLDTLTPFDLVVDPAAAVRSNKDIDGNHVEEHPLPMLYFAAPQLYEFYPNTVYPRLQQVRLETEVSHAGQVFRSHRHKCQRCSRHTWGPRLEEMGQAFILARLEAWLFHRRRTKLVQNCSTIVQVLHQSYQTNPPQQEDDACEPQDAVVRRLQLLYVVHKMILRYRAATSIVHKEKLRPLLTRLEVLADCLYGIYSRKLITAEERVPWRMSGIYQYPTSTDSVFRPEQLLTIDHPHWSDLVKNDDDDDLDHFRYLIHTPGRYLLGPQEDPNHLGELVAPSLDEVYPIHRQRKGSATDMFMDDPFRGLQSALITLHNPRSVLVHGIYDRVPYPGKVVRRPKLLQLFNSSKARKSYPPLQRDTFYRLQDALDLTHLAPSSTMDAFQSISMRRYLRNIPPLGMGRFPLSIDDGLDPLEHLEEKGEGLKAGPQKQHEQRVERQTVDADLEEDSKTETTETSKLRPLAASRIVELEIPESIIGNRASEDGIARVIVLPSETMRATNRGERAPFNNGVGNANFIFGGNLPAGPRLIEGPGPRLLNLLWSISAQLGWAVDDGSQVAAAVFVNRHLLIGLQWLSLALMVIPLFLTLCARAVGWIPCKPVDYFLEGLPYPLTSEMRFFSEHECAGAAVLLVLLLLYLGRWSERWTGRDFTRAMLEHTLHPLQSTFFERLMLRHVRRWDEICPWFIQRLTFLPQWNRRSMGDLMKHICFWKSQDFREHRSVLQATEGRGLMFWGGRWGEIAIEDASSRKLLVAAIGALGSFSTTTPHFWMNLLTVFSCSISLGLSMSLHSLDNGVTGRASGSIGAVLKSLNLVTLVSLSFLLGQLLGSSGGVLFLAEFVVTSISFILGGAGTISASSVESWACFFCLSSTAFWGYLFGRVALMDGVVRQKRLVRSSLFSTTLLCSSLAVVVVLWIVVSLWRWNLPPSLMILRPSMVKTARGASRTSAASGSVARTGGAAADYAAKHLQ